MERMYLDSVALICFVEQRLPWFPKLKVRLTSSPTMIVASDLTRMKCRVQPIRLGDMVRLAEFDAVFQSSELTTHSTAVFDRATDIRAHYRFKTPDSLHLAAAVESSCDVFLTNDQQLAQFPGIAVEVI